MSWRLCTLADSKALETHFLIWLLTVCDGLLHENSFQFECVRYLTRNMFCLCSSCWFEVSTTQFKKDVTYFLLLINILQHLNQKAKTDMTSFALLARPLSLKSDQTRHTVPLMQINSVFECWTLNECHLRFFFTPLIVLGMIRNKLHMLQRNWWMKLTRALTAPNNQTLFMIARFFHYGQKAKFRQCFTFILLILSFLHCQTWSLAGSGW